MTTSLTTPETSMLPSQPVVGRPWLPGQSGNPAGRRKDELTSLLRVSLRDQPKVAQELADRLIAIARYGKDAEAIKAFALIFDRLEGKAIQAITVNEEQQDFAAGLLAQIASAITKEQQQSNDG